jgi:hypothetical protein
VIDAWRNGPRNAQALPRGSRKHIATGDKNIARQRELIAQLERDSHDTASATTFLHEFEQLQAQHIAERERLLRELGEL